MTKNETNDKKEDSKKVDKKEKTGSTSKKVAPKNATAPAAPIIEKAIPDKGSDSNSSLATISLAMSLIALLVSLLIGFNAMKGKSGDNRLSDRQFQLIEKIGSISGKLESSVAKIESLENRLSEFKREGNVEKENRGLSELQKALIIFQEAKKLIKNDEMVQKIARMEEELKNALSTGEMEKEKDAENSKAENTDEEVAIELAPQSIDPEVNKTGENKPETSEIIIVNPFAQTEHPQTNTEAGLPNVETNEAIELTPQLEEKLEEVPEKAISVFEKNN